MTQPDDFRKEHDAALAMAFRLLELVHRYKPGQSAFAILMQVNRLFGLLRAHLAYEDIVLYPSLAVSQDRRLAENARMLAAETGDLGQEIEDFTRCWSCSASIAVRFEEFRESAHRLVVAIATRIEKENRLVLTLADGETEDAAGRAAA